jgi:hypothetical protein
MKMEGQKRKRYIGGGWPFFLDKNEERRLGHTITLIDISKKGKSGRILMGKWGQKWQSREFCKGK